MIAIVYTQEFIRAYASLEKALQGEVKEKIALVQKKENHKALKVHKLSGPLKGYLSFSVNYKYRIIFSFANNKKVMVLRTVGDHSIYD